jgi:general secretion pathway protein E
VNAVTNVAIPPTSDVLAQLDAYGALSSESAARAARVAGETDDRPLAVALKLGLVSERALAEALADLYALPWIDTIAAPPLQLDGCDTVQSTFWSTHEVVPLTWTATTLTIALWDPTQPFVIDALRFATGLDVGIRIAPRGRVLAALDSLTRAASNASGIATPTPTLASVEELDLLKDRARDTPVIRIAQRLIDQAVERRASDIHLEPAAAGLLVRYRCDGVLLEVERLDLSLSAALVSRIKVMAGLDVAERRLPQDGRIAVTVQGKTIDFRVATSPTLFGESVVLRILDRQDVALDFAALGFEPQIAAQIRAAVHRPHGIVLVTGPTGSGKTTTLYAALKEINSPQRKILTVEDPVEYTLAGVNQVPVRPAIGLTFAHTLRSFLRQDPDVLMVGEIRDRETADIAIQAALTGHLLLSTLHTNSAAASITRLLDMQIDDFLLTSTLQLVVGQRLVRRLCPHCRAPYRPEPEVQERFALTPADDVPWYRAAGCGACQHTGYRGRTSILEVLSLTATIRALILKRADAAALERAAIAEGMRTMFRHGLERVARGDTALEEVLRVTNADVPEVSRG